MSPTGSGVLTPAGGPLARPIHQRDRWSPREGGAGQVGEAEPPVAVHAGIPGRTGLGVTLPGAAGQSDRGCGSTFLMGCAPADRALGTPVQAHSGHLVVHRPSATPALPSSGQPADCCVLAGRLEPSFPDFCVAQLRQPRLDGKCHLTGCSGGC